MGRAIVKAGGLGDATRRGAVASSGVWAVSRVTPTDTSVATATA